MIRENVPNLLTCLNLACGVLAILTSNVDLGVFLILLGGIFDVFDGLVARALGVSSKIGGELDSLADVVSFGVAPAVLYFRSFAVEGQWLYLIGPVLLVIGGAIRLARFNVTESKTSYFEGLAIPSSGLLMCGLVYGRIYLPGLSTEIWLYLLIPVILAALNVSTFKMFSFKQFGSQKIKLLFAMILMITLVSIYLFPKLALAIALATYILIAFLNSFTVQEASA